MVNVDKENLEVGAGCGDFGEKFFPHCIITDFDKNIAQRCENHNVEVFCSALSLPWGDDRFQKVIMCNPYGYGFLDKDEAIELINEFCRVLTKIGQIIIVCSSKNPYANENAVRSRLPMFSEVSNHKISISVSEITEKTFPGYIFKKKDGKRALPDTLIEISVQKG